MPEILPYASPALQPNPDDLVHLKTLAISHDVFGVIIALSAVLGLIISAEEPLTRLYLTLIGAFGLAIAACGFCIHSRRLRILSILIAAILSLIFPLGTILGISTIAVLLRPSVRALYSASRHNLI